MNTKNDTAALEAAFQGVIIEDGKRFLYEGNPQHALIIQRSQIDKGEIRITSYGDPIEVGYMLASLVRQKTTLIGGTFVIEIDHRKARKRARRFKVNFIEKAEKYTKELLPAWPFTKSKPFQGDEVITLIDARMGAKYTYYAVMNNEGHIELIAKSLRGFFLSNPGHRKFSRDGVPLD